jgi:hypothetical protein
MNVQMLYHPNLVLRYPVFWIELGLVACFWVWPIMVYLHTGSWVKSGIAMGIEIILSILFVATFFILCDLCEWIKSKTSQTTK